MHPSLLLITKVAPCQHPKIHLRSFTSKLFILVCHIYKLILLLVSVPIIHLDLISHEIMCKTSLETSIFKIYIHHKRKLIGFCVTYLLVFYYIVALVFQSFKSRSLENTWQDRDSEVWTPWFEFYIIANIRDNFLGILSGYFMNSPNLITFHLTLVINHAIMFVGSHHIHENKWCGVILISLFTTEYDHERNAILTS